MANIFDNKLSLLEKITAIKALNQINLPNSISFPSLNGKNNPLDFLLDLVKITIGFEKLKDGFIDFLTNNIEDLNVKIKSDLLNTIKSFFYCNLNPTIPNDFIEGVGLGFSVQVKNIDFFKILKISPISIDGQLIYANNPNDLDVFLYNTIQSGLGVWENIFVVKFTPLGVVNGKSQPNVLNVTIHNSWAGKTLDELSIAIFDKLSLFNIDDLLVKIFDTVFGVVTTLRIKGTENAEQIAKIEFAIDKIVNVAVEQITDTFFDFNIDETKIINKRRDEIKRGVLNFATCDTLISELGYEQMLDLINNIRAAEEKSQIRNSLVLGIDNIFADAMKNVEDTNKFGTSLQLYSKMFKNIIVGIISSIISPKIILVINMYYSMFAQQLEYVDFDGFVKKIKNILIGIIRNKILPIITDYLYDLVLKELINLAKLNLNKLISETAKTKIGVLLSLVGVPDNIRLQIENLI